MEEKHTWDKTKSWSEEIDLLKSIVNKTDLVETKKWGGIVYTYNGKNVIGIGGFKNYFTIWFYSGVFLKDESGKLFNANEGVTKSLRQWRFTSKSEINEKLILAYISEAIEIVKAGSAIAPTPKSKNFTVPDVLKSALQIHKVDVDFAKLPPFKQYEFVEYIDTAKREETKRSRVEKILPMIKDGIGLNDKYRS